jgi:hypothetical protein
MGPLLTTTTMIGAMLAVWGVTLALTAVPASAHSSPITITCETITVAYASFPSTGTNSATVTINGTAQSFTWTGSTHTFSTSRPAGAVTVTTNWTGADGLTGSTTATDSGEDCSFPTTTTSTSTTSTSTAPPTVPPPVIPPGTCIGPPIACNPQPATTTTAGPTTTTIQVVPEVQPETAPTTTVQVVPEVQPESATAPTATPAVSGSELASTGFNPRGLTELALVLAGVGLALVGVTGRRIWSRRR